MEVVEAGKKQDYESLHYGHTIFLKYLLDQVFPPSDSSPGNQTRRRENENVIELLLHYVGPIFVLVASLPRSCKSTAVTLSKYALSIVTGGL